MTFEEYLRFVDEYLALFQPEQRRPPTVYDIILL